MQPRRPRMERATTMMMTMAIRTCRRWRPGAGAAARAAATRGSLGVARGAEPALARTRLSKHCTRAHSRRLRPSGRSCWRRRPRRRPSLLATMPTPARRRTSWRSHRTSTWWQTTQSRTRWQRSLTSRDTWTLLARLMMILNRALALKGHGLASSSSATPKDSATTATRWGLRPAVTRIRQQCSISRGVLRSSTRRTRRGCWRRWHTRSRLRRWRLRRRASVLRRRKISMSLIECGRDSESESAVDRR
mmetsp:Transcript_59736/g.129465  ORF Transcript_59736/g.129465 Transcript_59736/m.129465 type:complete len:248 (-) Transcript_59736:538-1281(-)